MSGQPQAKGLIRAAGAVLWRAAGPEPTVAVVHRPRYDDWSLPKGKLDTDETSLAAAVREVREETGFQAELGRQLGQVSYPVWSPTDGTARTKVVEYWAAHAVAGAFQPNAEVDELRWLTPDAADGLLSHHLDREVLRTFTAAPVPTATVLLVRHAKAGDRSQWSGDDNLRPLSARGLRQAAVLRTRLRLFGPTRVYSAEPLRCVDTVRPLAEDLGTVVVREPLLGEDGHQRDPAGTLQWLREIAEAGGVAVVCSQGTVIPAVVGALTGLDGSVANGKGGTWALFLHDQRLIAADYYPPP